MMYILYINFIVDQLDSYNVGEEVDKDKIVFFMVGA
jgi:hypothetical protein